MEKSSLFNSFYNDTPDKFNQKGRLSLLPLTDDILNKYIDDLWEYSSNEKFYAYLEYKCFASKQECLQYFTNILRSIHDNNGMLWLIILLSENKAIGTIRLTYWDLNRENVQVGYGISPKYGRNGYFTEALGSIIKFTFDVLGFYRIESWTRSDNVGSIKGIEKLGFEHEGTLRENNLKYDGTRHDVVIYSLLKSDQSIS